MRFFQVALLLFLSLPLSAQRPKVGVTLSGGGAKGLAHIGILKAIDSAGLKVDYVTGTSMGSVIGGLYAVGYSADSIEKLARSVDWDLLLSNQASLRSLFMEEKDEYNKYDIELPWVNNKFKISTGFLEAQELWLKLAEFYFPVTPTKDFSQFSIPFRCIATDVGNGQAVVLKDGELISAIRSSMAIPSVFTAIDHDGKRLVDGGISRNFPVRDVKEMGADIVIGSTVASGLLPPDKVRNIIQLLLQIAFFREAEDNKKEVPLCDIYIPFKLDNYTMASFGDADKILEAGMEEGRKLFPRFKALADSLNAIYGKAEWPVNRMPDLKTVYVKEVEVKGLENTSSNFFINTMNFHVNRRYTARELAGMIRQAYGTRYYSRIYYSLIPVGENNYRIVFDIEENPLTYLKAAVHYNRFSGIGVIANITSRNLLLSNSRSLASINLGESFRIRGEHLQYLGRLKDYGLTVKTQFDRFDVITYEQTKNRQSGLYKQNIFEVSERLHYSPTRDLTFGIGHKFEWLTYHPRIASGIEVRGSNAFSSFFTYLHHNSLDRSIFPKRGLKIEVELARVSHQRANVDVLVNGQQPADPDSSFISEQAYYRFFTQAEGYLPLSRRITAFAHAQAGANFNYQRNAMNEFVVGGLTRMFRNQITFAGMQEGAVYTPALASLQAGIRAQLFPGAYLAGRANILVNNIISRSDFFRYQDFYSGYALTFSYNFALGPLDLSVMFCDQTQRVQTYINLGIPF